MAHQLTAAGRVRRQDGGSCRDSARVAGQLAIKLKAGLAVGPALYALAVECKSRPMAEALKAVRAGLDKGRSLTACMREQPAFDEIFVHILGGGEARGRLLPEAQRAAGYLTTSARMDELFRAAGPRPLRLGGVALLVYLVAVGLAAPWVETTLRAAGHTQWSALTHASLRAAEVIRAVLPFVLAGLVVAWAAQRQLGRRLKGILWRDRLLLRLPVLGVLNRARAVADFNRAAGALLTAGVPLFDAMQAAARASRNLVVRGAVLHEAGRLAQARDAASVLVEGGLVPRGELNAVQAAERRGELGPALSKLAAQLDAELERRARKLKSLVQSATVLFLGLLIAAAMLALYVPVFVEH